jgi:hypothetical protein
VIVANKKLIYEMQVFLALDFSGSQLKKCISNAMGIYTYMKRDKKTI